MASPPRSDKDTEFKAEARTLNTMQVWDPEDRGVSATKLEDSGCGKS